MKRVALQVGQFALVGVVALGVVVLATTIASRRIGERQAITDARSTTVVRAEGRVLPVLTDAFVAGDATSLQAVDAAVRQGVLDDSLVRVKIWRSDGTILYSDEPRLIGTTYTLGSDEQASIATGSIEAEVSDLNKPENRYERSFNRLLEVYLPLAAPGGESVLFEAYFRYDAVAAAGNDLWKAFAPMTIGSLVVLQLVQLPLAWSLAHRLRRRVEEREGLLQAAIDASDVERLRIAADLHDGVVQDLAGVAFALSGAARRADGADDGLLEASAEQVRGSIKALRTLLVDIYPPNLEQEGLEAALGDLVATVTARGLEVDLQTDGTERPLSLPAAQLLYRATQEGLRNVVRHAGASRAWVRVSIGDRRATTSVSDDGRGIEGDPLTAAPDGHMGLRSLDGLVRDAGGQLRLRRRPEGGTELHVEVGW